MEQVENSTVVKTLTPQALATRLGISPKRMRQILRVEYPRDTKGKKWEIPLDVTKRVEKAHKAKTKAKNEKRKAQIKKEVEGS